jgi:hypothetical protein
MGTLYKVWSGLCGDVIKKGLTLSKNNIITGEISSMYVTSIIQEKHIK